MANTPREDGNRPRKRSKRASIGAILALTALSVNSACTTDKEVDTNLGDQEAKVTSASDAKGKKGEKFQYLDESLTRDKEFVLKAILSDPHKDDGADSEAAKKDNKSGKNDK